MTFDKKMQKRVPILIADDDVDDCQMIAEAFRESRLLNQLQFVHHGEQLMNYLHGIGEYGDRERFPLPGLILLDLNMPRRDGRECLADIKGDPRLRQIPVVVLTTSQAEEDVYRTYGLGVNSFITKPVAFSAMVEIMSELGKYWLEIVEIPNPQGKD